MKVSIRESDRGSATLRVRGGGGGHLSKNSLCDIDEATKDFWR